MVGPSYGVGSGVTSGAALASGARLASGVTLASGAGWVRAPRTPQGQASASAWRGHLRGRRGVGRRLGVSGAGVGSGVGAGVGSGVGAGVGSGVGAGVGSGVGAGVGSGVGAGVGSGVGAGVCSGVGAAACSVASGATLGLPTEPRRLLGAAVSRPTGIPGAGRARSHAHWDDDWTRMQPLSGCERCWVTAANRLALPQEAHRPMIGGAGMAPHIRPRSAGLGPATNGDSSTSCQRS